MGSLAGFPGQAATFSLQEMSLLPVTLWKEGGIRKLACATPRLLLFLYDLAVYLNTWPE
jgi:hypothetical protein